MQVLENGIKKGMNSQIIHISCKNHTYIDSILIIINIPFFSKAILLEKYQKQDSFLYFYILENGIF